LCVCTTFLYLYSASPTQLYHRLCNTVITKIYERYRPRDHAHAVDKTTASASISTFTSLSTNLAPTIMVAAGLTSPKVSSNALPTASVSSCSVTNIRTRATSSLLPCRRSTELIISLKMTSVWR